MLIVKLGSHDMIIGRNYFDYFRILTDVHYRRLHWPMEFPRLDQPAARTTSATATPYRLQPGTGMGSAKDPAKRKETLQAPIPREMDRSTP